VSTEQRDVFLMFAPTAIAAAIYFLGREYVPPRLLVPVAFAVNFLGHLAVKGFVRDHIVWKLIPWTPLVTVALVIVAATALLADWTLLG
jgi:hypothetical protein